MRRVRHIQHWLLLLALTSAAHAAPTAHCVVVRKPTAQQREASAADVERLLDDYEAKTSDTAAWPSALEAVFDRFPLPSVNLLLALHHPAWASPERKLLAYVEAIRQDPLDYADPAAAAQTIKRIKQLLASEVQHRPLLIVEARGVVRQQELLDLDLRVDEHMCAGNSIAVGAEYSISWADDGRRLAATLTSPLVAEGEDWCVAIDRNSVGPCHGKLVAIAAPIAAPIPAVRPSAQPSPSSQAHAAMKPSAAPSIDVTLAISGLALTAIGFGAAVYARHQVDVHMDRAEGGSAPSCRDRKCSQSGMTEVVAAKDWQSASYVAGAVGALGIAGVIAAGHRYYARWVFPSYQHAASNITPIATAHGAGLLVESRF